MLSAAPARPAAAPAAANDVHSRLNGCRHAFEIGARRVDDVVGAVRLARERGLPLAVCGGRHAMGGQQFASGGILLDVSGLDRVRDFDPGTGRITAEAGIQWPALMRRYLELQPAGPAAWGIRQKQTGADRLSIGGSVSANIHGRVLDDRPLVRDVLALTLVDAEGRLLECTRDTNAELFRLAVGGYGLFGPIVDVTLQLVPRQKLMRIVELAELDEIEQAFAARIAAGYLYGDFQFATDAASADFLRRGVFSCYRPVDPATPIPEGQVYMTPARWQELLYHAHVDKSRAFELFADFYLASSGQAYWSDAHQFSLYLDDYHGELDRRLCPVHPGTEMITELYVPRGRLKDYMGAASDVLRRHRADLIYGTVRLIRRDDESFLAWAREDFACVIFNLHVEHTPTDIAANAVTFRELIDAALALGGSYFLTYHRYASATQVERAYPQFREFLAHKRRYDPQGIFSSDWYRHQARLLGVPA